MIVKPKIRGFICTTAHPTGCYKNVENAVDYAKTKPNPASAKRVLVIGSSSGYGLATRIATTFSGGADTVGVFFERAGSEKRTATAGYYNNLAFEKLADQAGRKHKSINGDAFSREIKGETIAAIKSIMPEGKVDLVIYSLASPKRIDHGGNEYSSVIKPVGKPFKGKSLNFNTGEIIDAEVPPATEEEIQSTIKVMGGEDWQLWIGALKEADCLGENATTVSFSYIGPEVTHEIYTNGTIGMAKKDMEEKAVEITNLLKPIGGKAFVSVNKALVTQASSAIPVVPLYISILYKVMKEAGTHEDSIQQAVRLLQRLYGNGVNNTPVDSQGRIRLDDWEMEEDIQAKVLGNWATASTDNIGEFADLEGYKKAFYNLFGFQVDGVDYSKDVEIDI